MMLLIAAGRLVIRSAFVAGFLALPWFVTDSGDISTLCRAYFAEGVAAFIAGYGIVCLAALVQSLLARRGPGHVAFRMAAVLGGGALVLWPVVIILRDAGTGSWLLHPGFRLFLVAAFVRFGFDACTEPGFMKGSVRDPLISLFLYFGLLFVCTGAINFSAILFIAPPVNDYDGLALVLLRVVQAVLVVWMMAAASLFVFGVVGPYISRRPESAWADEILGDLPKWGAIRWPARLRLLASGVMLVIALPVEMVSGMPWLPQVVGSLSEILLRGIGPQPPTGQPYPVTLWLEAAGTMARNPFRIASMVGGDEQPVRDGTSTP